MFTIRKELEFKRKIKVKIPVDGGFRSEEFTATFRMLESEEAREIHENGGDRKDQALLEEVFIGLDGVKDEDGNALSYSDEVRDRLIDIPYVALPLVMAYFDAISGGRAKN